MALINKLKAIANAIRLKTNKSEELTLEQMASAILDLSGNINLQDKSITITENGTTTITADEGFDGLSSVEVESAVYDDGFDFESIELDANSINDWHTIWKDAIDYAKELQAQIGVPTGSWQYKFQSNKKLLIMPYVDISKISNFHYAWNNCFGLYYLPNSLDFSKAASFDSTWCNCYNLRNMPNKLNIPNVPNLNQTWRSCIYLKKIEHLHAPNVTIFKDTWNGCYSLEYLPEIDTAKGTNMQATFKDCSKLKNIILTSVEKVTNFTYTFSGTGLLETLFFTHWKKVNISVSASPNLKAVCIHNIIQNAMSLADGATARTLTLHATAKANWEASEYYQEDLAVLEEKGITIA